MHFARKKERQQRLHRMKSLQAFHDEYNLEYGHQKKGTSLWKVKVTPVPILHFGSTTRNWRSIP